MIKGMLKWAVGKDDRPINPTKSLKKRRKLEHVNDMQRDAPVGLISGCSKQGPSKIQNKNRVGVINNNHQCLNNEPDNGKVNSPNYKVPDQSPSPSPTTITTTIDTLNNHNANNNNNTINSDTKSLLYMRLDNLPKAIVKQYERMLQDAPLKPKSVLKTQHVTNFTNSNHRSLNCKTKSQKHLSSQQNKKSKSITFREDVNEKETSKTKGGKSCPTPLLKPPEISIKEAHNRPLKVLSTSKVVKTQPDRNKTSSPQTLNEKYPHNLIFSAININNNTNSKRKANLEEKQEEKSPQLPVKKTLPTIVCDTKLLASSNPSNSKTFTTNNEIPINKTIIIKQENDENNDPNLYLVNNTQVKKTNNEVSSIKAQSVMSRIPNPHDITTDPLFLEKPITYSTPPVSKCAKKLTLKRSELKKLERLKTQTEKLNRFLQKYYHDCLPNLPEEEEETCSPEEKSVRLSILRTHWQETNNITNTDSDCFEEGESSDIMQACYENINKNRTNRFPYSNPNINNKFSPLLSSSSTTFSFSQMPELSVDDYAVTWENLLNSSIPNDTPSKTTGCTLPIIQEVSDSGEVSSSSEYHHSKKLPSVVETHNDKEKCRDSHYPCNNGFGMDESFLMSRTRIQVDDSLVALTKDSMGLSEENTRDRMSDNFNSKIPYDEEDEGGSDDDDEEGGVGIKKLKGLMAEPLGELFETPASLAEDEGFMSPYPPEVYSPSSSSSTFNRFSLSSSGKGSEEHENFEDDYDKEESNRSSSQSSKADQIGFEGEEGGPKYIIMELKHENANYLSVEESCNNQTWNSLQFPSSPCGTTISLNSHSSIPSGDDEHNLMRNKRENDHEEESFICNKLALAFSTPVSKIKNLPQTSLKSLRSKKPSATPRKLVKKAQVNSAFSKGEFLIRAYKNDGDYVTVHVIQARRLEPHTSSSWKLSIKLSLLPEAETTFTRSSETIIVGRNKSWVKIDQKFSFEVPPATRSDTKVFLTAIKRLGKKPRPTFLGWTTLPISSLENTQNWIKLRKRKVNTATYPSQSSSSHCHTNSKFSRGGQLENDNRSSSMDSPSPQPGQHNDASSSSSRCDCELEPKSQLQNSSTMDSGVEDCCEPPPPPAPSIDLDDKSGQRVHVKMIKGDSAGYGFSVVWVSPPRIERLELGKVADAAGCRVGDLIIGVNGEDVTTAPNTTIYSKMKSTGNVLGLELWRMTPPAQSRSSVNSNPTTSSKMSSIASTLGSVSRLVPNINDSRQTKDSSQQQQNCSACLPSSTNNANKNQNINQVSSTPPSRVQSQPPPTSILKPPPPAPPGTGQPSKLSHPQSQPPAGSTAWKIRFNIELLDNEDDCLKQFFICELKFFRKVVAALDRYLIPVQSNRLLSPQEINLMFSSVIKIITVTKRILNCVANGSSVKGWKFNQVLLRTHSDHLSEMVSAYTAYAKTLGHSSMILSEKMSLQEFARFVLETTVPKGHLDMTSLLFAPLEHLRNICEICEAISHNSEDWVDLFTHLKECYADIVCETDFMEPISHVSMKKNPLLSVRDLEKRVVSVTSCQPVKVCEKGRRWLFGSRLFKKESDGSWTPVWAFLFTDIIVLTSHHTTRDRVFFVKEAPIVLQDVVTLHFNLQKKHENEFRLLFEPEPVHQSRFDKILPLHRNKKSHQIALRAPNIQLKSMWKLLLQRQIITLNTTLSKSASSNFSISEFCERFPITPQCEDDEIDERVNVSEKKAGVSTSHNGNFSSKTNSLLQHSGGLSKPSGTGKPQNTIFDKQTRCDERNLGVIKEEKCCGQTKIQQKSYAPDGLSSLSKELLKSRVPRVTPDRTGNVNSDLEKIKVTKPSIESSDSLASNSNNVESLSKADKTNSDSQNVTINSSKAMIHNNDDTTRPKCPNNQIAEDCKRKLPEKISSITVCTSFASNTKITNVGIQQQCPSISTQNNKPLTNSTQKSPTNNNNNEIRDFNKRTASSNEKCPCEVVQEKAIVNTKTVNNNEANCRKIDGAPSNSNNNSNKQLLTPSSSLQRTTIQTTTKGEGSEANNLTNPNLIKSIDSKKMESPHRIPRHDDQIQNRNVLSASPYPSPSLGNNRVKALKYEGGGSGIIKSKPGSKIITNATLKSRQQELLAQKEGQTIIAIVENSSASSGTTDDILISQHIEANKVVTMKDASSSPLLNAPRCQSANGFVNRSKVHTDSPILTGYGSEKSRRRVLYDYKVQRDYPELFGITPKDRRSFIKRLAEKQPDSEKSLVAPYYFSPTPTPKFPKKVEGGKIPGENTTIQTNSSTIQFSIKETHQLYDYQKASNSNNHINNNNSQLFLELRERLEEKNLVGRDETEEKSEIDMSLKDIARGLLRNVRSDDKYDTSDDDDDDDRLECHGRGDEVRAQVHRQRSPEESSNDSGISDELTDKSKRINNNKDNGAVNSSEVKISTKILPKNAHACITTPTQNNKIHHVCFEGEEETGMATMVVLKADKSIGTDDDPYFKPEKSMRTLMAERREAFFANYQHPTSNQIPSSYFTPPPKPRRAEASKIPLRVKIIEGGTLHTTHPEPPPPPTFSRGSPPSERVQLTRFPEKEKNARVERVESSSDDSTSSVASASPAGENGTTEPSWSDSSSSLAGYSGSKEEPSTSTSVSTSRYNNSFNSFNDNDNQVASTSSLSRIFMSDFTHNLPSTSFCSFSNNTLSLNGPEIVVTQESPETPTVRNGCSSEGEEEDSVLCNSKPNGSNNGDSLNSSRKGFLRVESNDSTVENYGDDDDYNFDDEDELSQCSATTMNRYGTFESLEKIENEDNLGGLPDFSRPMPRSKARFTFEDDSDDDNDLFEEDFESDFNFRFPTQIQDNTYSVSRLGPLSVVLEEDNEDDMYDDQRPGSSMTSHPGPSTSSGQPHGASSLRARHEISSNTRLEI